MTPLSRGFTLIELMVVVAILAVLAAIAIPQYQNYVVRAQLTRAVAELTNLRIHAEPCINDGWLTVGSGASQCDIGAIRSNLMQAEPTIALSGTARISATLGQSATPVLHGTQIALQRDDDGRWGCEIATPLRAALLPAGCRAP